MDLPQLGFSTIRKKQLLIVIESPANSYDLPNWKTLAKTLQELILTTFTLQFQLWTG